MHLKANNKMIAIFRLQRIDYRYNLVEMKTLVKLSVVLLSDYSVEREHAGLRRIAGYGVTITRGAASGMMFTFSCLLVTMCRNLITFCRETFLNRYIPFDGYIKFHIYIALCGLFFTGQGLDDATLFHFINICPHVLAGICDKGCFLSASGRD